MKSEKVINKVHSMNKKVHDDCAILHDEKNTYIQKKSCKKFYEDLFTSILEKNKLSLKGSNCLELGCGTGNFADFIMSKGNSYKGVDISKGMIDIANSKKVKGANFECRDVESFFEEKIKNKEKYDVIFSFSFVHHLYDINTYFKNIGDCLNEGGIYIGLHEPIIKESTPALLSIEYLLLHLFGYSNDEGGFFKRLYNVIGRISKFVFKSNKNEINNSGNISDIDFVDYQFQEPDKFKTEVIEQFFKDNNINGNCEIYSYTSFPLLFGKVKFDNHFYIVLRGNKKK